jgi:hypothetical protein
MDEATFTAALDELRARHENRWSPQAQEELQALHLKRAEALEATGSVEAAAHLRAAEDAQWRIVSEGLPQGQVPSGPISMSRLYEIRGRRARLMEKVGDLAEALSLWESIAADKSGQGAFAQPEVERLRAKMA